MSEVSPKTAAEFTAAIAELVVQRDLARAEIATAVARARREALEEAVGRFDDLAAKARERQTTATNMDDLHHAIRAASAAADAAEQVRALISQEPGR